MKKSTTNYLSLFFLSLSLSLFSQDKVDKEEKLWSGNVGISMIFNDGNTNSKTQNAKGDLKKETDYGHFAMYGEYNEGSTEGVTYKRDSKVGAKIAKDINDVSYLFLNFETHKDQFKNLDRRNTTDLGYGYKILNNDKSKFNVEAGVSYVYENYEKISSEKYWALNISDNFTHELETGVQLFQKGKYVPSVESSRKYTIMSEQGIRSKLSETINLDLSVKLMYDNTIPKDIFGNPILRDNGHQVRRLETVYQITLNKTF